MSGFTPYLKALNSVGVSPLLLLAMIPLATVSTLVASPTFAASQFRVVHYNIRELDCAKLSNAEINQSSEPQVKLALDIIKTLKPDLLSINEMQYDRFQQPNLKCSTPKDQEGLNAQRLARLLKWPLETTAINFGDANTGQGAWQIPTGGYSTDSAKGGIFADPVNFGLFPGQYSTAALSRFRKISSFSIRDLLWNVFEPNINLTGFSYLDKRVNGQTIEVQQPDMWRELPYDPATLELFDKNFNDMVVEIDGKPVHFITLHTLVGGNFGNEGNTSNELRNAAELAFLEWYLTGETILNGKVFNAPQVGNIKHLSPTDYYIAVGDWNVEVDESPTHPGSVALKRLFSKSQRWHEQKLPTQQTWQNFNANPHQYDYMVVSKNISILKSGGYLPAANRANLGCGIEKPQASNSNRVVVSYRSQGKQCFAEINRANYLTRQASDHYPIWAELRLK